MTHISLYLSIASIFVFVAVYSGPLDSFIYDNASRLFVNLSFWLTVAISVFFSLLPNLVINYFVQQYYPANKDIVRERWKYDMDSLNQQHVRPNITNFAEEASVWRRRVQQYVGPLSSYLVFMRSSVEKTNTGFGFSQGEGTQGQFLAATSVPNNFHPVEPDPSWFSRKVIRNRENSMTNETKGIGESSIEVADQPSTTTPTLERNRALSV
jgi:hypothetical protein